jgi:hypothetical protein
MNSIPQTNGRCIIGPPYLTCVDLDGTQTPLTSLWTGPSEAIDPTDAAAWPQSNLVDGWFWETDAADVAELEADEIERLADMIDAPDSAWCRMMAESLRLPLVCGGAPEPTPADRADLEAWLDQVDASYPPHDQHEDLMGFPSLATADDRHAFQSDIAEFFRTHPGV